MKYATNLYIFKLKCSQITVLSYVQWKDTAGFSTSFILSQNNLYNTEICFYPIIKWVEIYLHFSTSRLNFEVFNLRVNGRVLYIMLAFFRAF